MKIVGCLSALFLTGCAAFSTTSFDPVEYDHWIYVSYTADRAVQSCGTTEEFYRVGGLVQYSNLATRYSSSKISNKKIAEAAAIVNGLVAELAVKYEDDKSPSEGYCKLKLREIDVAARTLAESLSKKES